MVQLSRSCPDASIAGVSEALAKCSTQSRSSADDSSCYEDYSLEAGDNRPSGMPFPPSSTPPSASQGSPGPAEPDSLSTNWGKELTYSLPALVPLPSPSALCPPDVVPWWGEPVQALT